MTAPSLTTTAPTSGFGVVRPRPPSASSIARARCTWSVCSSVVTTASPRILTRESTSAATEPADRDLRPQAIVCERGGVVGEIEGEGAGRAGTHAVQDRAAALERAVVGDGIRHGVRLAQRAAHLRRAGEHVAVAAARIAVEHGWAERALVVLELDPLPAVVRGAPLVPAPPAFGQPRGVPDVGRPLVGGDRLDHHARALRDVDGHPGARQRPG